MSDESVVVEATPTMQVESGPLVNMSSDERAEFRKTGEMPKPKSEEAAASSDLKPVEAKPTGESETPKSEQEKPKAEAKPKQTAEERIAQLEATIKKIREGSGQKEAPKAESAPAKSEPQVQQKPQYTRPKPTAEDKNDDGTDKFSTYEDYIEELSDWKAEQRDAKTKAEAAQQAQSQRTAEKVEAAKGRYADFAEVVGPAVDAIVGDASVSPVVKQMIDDSDVFADLVYTIGSKPEDLASFLRMAKENPGKAIRYIALTESLINEELEGKPASEEAPVKPRTQAPKPPAEAGGRASTPPDGLESAAKANDFRAFKAESLRRDLARLKT